MLSANWTATDPALADIKIGTTWWDGNTFYQIHTKPLTSVVKPLGNQWEYRDTHQLHIFAKGNSGKDKKWKMEKEVMRILIEKATAIGTTGIQWGWPTGPIEVPEQDPRSEVVHSIVEVTLYFHKLIG